MQFKRFAQICSHRLGLLNHSSNSRILSYNAAVNYYSNWRPHSRFSSKSSATESLPLPSIWRRFRITLRYFWLSLVAEPNENAFNAEDIAARYVRDNMNVSQWCLIYDNRIAAVFQRVTTLLAPISFLSFSLMAIDYHATDGEFSIRLFRVLADHAVDMGQFIYIPIIASALVMAIIIRGQNRQLFRMYMNRQDSERLCILIARSGIFRRWIDVTRDQLEVLPAFNTPSNTVIAYLRSYWYGQLRVCGISYFVDDMFFRSNNLQSFILRETSKRPQNLDTLDLDNVYLRSMLGA